MMENVMKTEMDALLLFQMDTAQRSGNGGEVDKETAKSGAAVDWGVERGGAQRWELQVSPLFQHPHPEIKLRLSTEEEMASSGAREFHP
ncbi:unnamed protein product [Gadus morhua 'NCC']